MTLQGRRSATSGGRPVSLRGLYPHAGDKPLACEDASLVGVQLGVSEGGLAQLTHLPFGGRSTSSHQGWTRAVRSSGPPDSTHGEGRFRCWARNPRGAESGCPNQSERGALRPSSSPVCPRSTRRCSRSQAVRRGAVLRPRPVRPHGARRRDRPPRRSQTSNPTCEAPPTRSALPLMVRRLRHDVA